MTGISAVILAGGLGTRLREVVPDLPKPMAPINGRPFLEHQLNFWIGQGITRFILSVGYKREAITGHFGARYRRVEIEYAIEEQPLGTGGGLLLATRHLLDREPFLVLNGDTFFEVPLKVLRAYHVANGADVTLALFRTQVEGRYLEVRTGPRGEIIELKGKAGTKGGLANGGVYLIERGVVERIAWDGRSPLSLEDNILPDVLRSGGRLMGFECAGRFIDIGLPEDYARAADVLGILS